MNSNNDIQDPSFLELIKSFESGLVQSGPIPVEEFRLYYNEDGRIVGATTTVHEAELLNIPLPYLIVNKEQYQFFTYKGSKIANWKKYLKHQGVLIHYQ